MKPLIFLYNAKDALPDPYSIPGGTKEAGVSILVLTASLLRVGSRPPT